MMVRSAVFFLDPLADRCISESADLFSAVGGLLSTLRSTVHL